MKTSTPTPQNSAQEECGVWLDTVQLKGKAKQKRPARPISKLLNPFVGGEGYSLAVALNFTQTKMVMPKTKQSNISTFFAPQSRVLHKMSTSEVQNMDPVQLSSSSTLSQRASSASTPVELGIKRRREIDVETFDACNTEPGVDHEWKSENMTEPEAAVWQEQAARRTPSQNMYCEFEEDPLEGMNSPQSKRRLTAASSLRGDSQRPPQAWSQDPLFTCSKYFEGEFDLINQKNTTEKISSKSEPSFLNSLQSEDAVGIQIDAKGRASIQKSFKHFHSSQADDEKENSGFVSSKSPRKHSALSLIAPLSNHKQTGPKSASPRKHSPVCAWKRADNEQSLQSQFKWAKPSSSPLKTTPRLSCREVDEDSLAMLFTQDSEGFRVIAHRGLQVMSPLKEQSNITSRMVGRTSTNKSFVEEDEEDEMLFTQDSQGNMVIKH